MKDEQLRRKAAEFYLKPSGILGLHEDWIEGRDNGAEVDADITSLYALLRAIADAQIEECAVVCDAIRTEYFARSMKTVGGIGDALEGAAQGSIRCRDAIRSLKSERTEGEVKT
ncbi:MAG: hypothetical protein NT024_00610 [Proteobacteria bacterium]|nr:hypothetical protein [Pseudomonadota bacterium]